MKTIQNVLVEKDGKPVIDAGTEKQLDTLTCVRALFDNVEYSNREDQRAADKLYDKLDSETESFDLEDSEFDLIKKYIVGYKPYLNGRFFSPILAQFE